MSLSIGLGAAIGWVRYKRNDPAFRPFLLLLSIGFINELLSICLIETGHSNIFNYNAFELVESFLLTRQFYKWGLFGFKKGGYYRVQIFFVLLWLAENYVSSFRQFNSYFIIVHSMVLFVMSINMLNRVIVEKWGSMMKEPIFLICTGLIVYFDYQALVETFWVFGLQRSMWFRLGVFQILAYINLLTNLIFAYAFLWIPMKPQYIFRS